MPNNYTDQYGNTFTDFSGAQPQGQMQGDVVSASAPSMVDDAGVSTRATVKPAYKGGSSYLIGYGMIGPDLEGAVKGDMLKQQYKLAATKDARDEEYLGLAKEDLGIKKDYLAIAQEQLGIQQADLAIRQDTHSMVREEFGWKRDAKAKEDIIQAGMTQASQEGGLPAVVDYLRSVDPKRAIEYKADQLKLEDQMLRNDVLKGVAATEKSKALVEGYGVLGKFGAAITQAPPEQQQAMYDQIKPMVKQIVPDAPSSVRDAIPMFGLAAAQATPAAMLFNQNKASITAQSNVGKLDMDIKSRLAAGMKMDDPGLQSLVAARDTYVAKQQQAVLAKTATELKLQTGQVQNESTVFRNTRNIQGDVNTSSKDYLSFMNTYAGVKAQLEVLNKDPTNPAAQGMLSRLMATAVQSGVLTDKDVSETVKSDAGMAAVMNEYATPWSKGQIVNLSPTEIKNLTATFQSTAKLKTERQAIIEKQFKDTLDGYGDVIKKNQIRFPSEQYTQMEESSKYGRIVDQYKLGDLPPEAQRQAAEAIDAGSSPQYVMQMADKMRQQARQQTEAQQQ